MGTTRAFHGRHVTFYGENGTGAGQARFEVEGADPAASVLIGHGVPAADVDRVWEAIALRSLSATRRCSLRAGRDRRARCPFGGGGAPLDRPPNLLDEVPLGLLGRGESRPVPDEGRVQVELTTIGEDQRAQRNHRLGGGPDVGSCRVPGSPRSDRRRRTRATDRLRARRAGTRHSTLRHRPWLVTPQTHLGPDPTAHIESEIPNPNAIHTAHRQAATHRKPATRKCVAKQKTNKPPCLPVGHFPVSRLSDQEKTILG